MAEKKVIELEVSSNLGNLKQQLKQAQVEVQTLAEKFGATSAQAVEAAKKAAILKDKIGDAKALTDAFNPDAKFKALSGALTGVAGGFSVVTGALGAFGKQNEDVEKALLKVQSAMALASGAQAIGESIDSFKQLGAVIKANSVFQKIMTAAQYAYNLAMSLNPIGAIIAATIALIAVGYKLITMFQASAKANDDAEKSTTRNTKALNAQIKASDKSSEALKTKNGHELNMAKATGASAEAIRKLTLKHADEAIALDKASLATARNTYEKEKNTLANMVANGVSDELIEKQKELVKKARENVTEERKDLVKSYEEKKAVVRNNEVEIAQEIFDKKQKIKENSKKEGKELIDITKNIEDEKLRLQEEGLRKELDGLKLKYARKKEEEDKQLKEKTLTQKDYDTLQKQATESLEFDKKQIIEKYVNQESQLKTVSSRNAIQGLVDSSKTRLEIEKATSEKSIEIAKEEKEKKAAILQQQLTLVKDSFQAFADVATLFAGKNKKAMKTAFIIQKASNIAQTTIDTYTSAMSAYKSALAVPVIGVGLAPIAAAGAVAVGLSNIRKIASQQFEGGGTPSADTGGTAPNMSAPQFNVVGQSGVNQLASLNQQPIQAYVVSGQVTSQQALDRNRLANATLGG
jgi:hypothetical protein